MKKNSKLIFLILLIFSIPSVIGLLHSGFPLTDDGNWMVIRLSSFYENLRDGQFPVRFLSRLNHGYGYPVADFLYPGFMYIGSLIHVLGFSFANSIKIILGLSLILSAIFSFLWLRKIFDEIPAFIGSLIYLYFPYHLYDVYQRGSVGEVLTLAVLPFILWQLENKNIFLTSLGISILIISHNSLALLLIPLIIFYFIFRHGRNIKSLLIPLFLGLGISAFFWIPAIFDQQYTIFGKTQVSDFYFYFVDKINLGLFGLIFVFIVLEGLFYLLRKKDQSFFYILLIFVFIGFLTISYSAFLWKILPFENLIQFPFRLLSLTIVFASFIAAYLLNKESKEKKYILYVVFIVLIFFSAWPFLFPKSYQFLPDSFYSTNQDTTTVKNEYMPKWVKEIPTSMYVSKVVNIDGKEEVNIEKISPNKIIFQTFLSEKRTIAVNTIYFPGWTAYVNGKLSDIQYDNPSGIIQLSLEKGENNVSISFKETPIRILSNLISVMSFGSLFLLWYFVKYKKFKV